MLPLSFPDAEVLILRRCIFEGSPARWEGDRTKAAAALRTNELILRRCIFEGSNPARWEGDRTKAAAALSEANIWGGRRQLVWPFAKTWVGGVAEGP